MTLALLLGFTLAAAARTPPRRLDTKECRHYLERACFLQYTRTIQVAHGFRDMKTACCRACALDDKCVGSTLRPSTHECLLAHEPVTLPCEGGNYSSLLTNVEHKYHDLLVKASCGGQCRMRDDMDRIPTDLWDSTLFALLEGRNQSWVPADYFRRHTLFNALLKKSETWPKRFANDSETLLADVDWSRESCPRTYVYQLPDQLNDYDGTPTTSLDGVEANANLLEVLVDRLSRSSHCATRDAYDADLFLVPVLPRAKGWQSWTRACDDIAQITSDEWRRYLPHLNEETASRHFFVFPRVAYAKRCRGWWAPPFKLKLFEDVTRVSVGGYEEFTYRTVQKFARLSADTRARPYHLIPRLVSAPYASDIEMRSGDQRHYLWAYASTVHGPDKARSLREALSRQCASSDACATGKSADGKTSTGKAARDTHIDRQRDATFCVEPPGLTPGRASIVTALLSGCIPVLFAPEQDKLWPLHWGGWRQASRVMLDMNRATADPSYVDDALRAIPAATVEAMRATIRRRAGAFRFHRDDVRGDAVHVLLRGVLSAAEELE